MGALLSSRTEALRRTFVLIFFDIVSVMGEVNQNHVRKRLSHHKAATGFILAVGVKVFLPKYAMH